MYKVVEREASMKRKTYTRIMSMVLIVLMLITLFPTGVFAEEGDAGEGKTINVKITQTNIKADGVFNTGGYGSLVIEAVYEGGTQSGKLLAFPQAALVDRNGKLVFPYRDTWLRFYCNGKIASLVGDSAFELYTLFENDYSGDFYEEIAYYNLDGSTAFDTDSYIGGSPMLEDYTLVAQSEIKKISEDESAHMLCLYLVDKSGTVSYAFPEAETFLLGGGPYFEGWRASTMATWYRDGLLLCWEYDSRMDYAVARGIVSSIYYIDKSGKKVVTLSPEKYSNSWPFSEGYAGVESSQNGLKGFVNKTGKEVIACQYDETLNFVDGIVGVKKNGKWGYINSKNETVIPFEYDDAFGAGGGLAAVGKNGKYGLVDYNNNIVVPMEYDDMSSFVGGVAYAIKDGLLYIITEVGGGWQQDSKGWWYQNADGTYPTKKWQQIDGKWYYFDASGYMLTGWQKIDGVWYYLGGGGAMATGWRQVGGAWYYFGSAGAMATGWKQVGGAWYYFGSSGAMRVGWVKDGGAWYYMSNSGAMQTGWRTIDGKTYFLKSSGVMAAGEYCGGWWLNNDGAWTYPSKATWRKSGSRWWYGDDTGWYAKSGKYTIDGKVYTFDAAGWMK